MTHYPIKKDAETVDKSILDTIAKLNPAELIKQTKN